MDQEHFQLRTAIDQVINKLNFATASLHRAKHDQLIFPPFMKKEQGHLNSAGLDIQQAQRKFDHLLQQFKTIIEPQSTLKKNILEIREMFQLLHNPQISDAGMIDRIIRLLRVFKDNC